MTKLLIFSWPTLYFLPFHCAKKRSAAAYFYFFCSVQSPRSNCTFFPDATVNYLAHSTSVCPLNFPRHSTCFDWHCLALFDSDFIAFRMALWLVSLSLDLFLHISHNARPFIKNPSMPYGFGSLFMLAPHFIVACASKNHLFLHNTDDNV